MKASFCVLSLALEMLKHRTVIYLQLTRDVNVYHKEMSGDLTNIKNGLEFLLKIIVV